MTTSTTYLSSALVSAFERSKELYSQATSRSTFDPKQGWNVERYYLNLLEHERKTEEYETVDFKKVWAVFCFDCLANHLAESVRSTLVGSVDSYAGKQEHKDAERLAGEAKRNLLKEFQIFG